MGLFFIILVTIISLIVTNKLWCFWCRSKVCLIGKTAIVTGSASGIGFQAALGLAAKGCRVIVADQTNVHETVEELKRQSHNSNIIGVKIDLQSFKSVRKFAKIIIESEPRLDILICNAAIGSYRLRKMTEDGLVRTMQVNYFSHFLLVHLLLDLLKKSAPSRIVFTSSLMAYFSDLDIENLNPGPAYYKRLWSIFNGGTYSNSKLCLVAAAKLFGEKLKGTGVTANVTPSGGVKTPIYWTVIKEEQSILAVYLMIVVFIYGKTPEEGAQTLLHLASSDELKNVTGQAFVEGMKFLSPIQLNDEFCKKLWDASIKLTKLQPHEIKC